MIRSVSRLAAVLFAPALACALATTAPAATPTPVPAPDALLHVGDWTAYRSANHIAALPVEARLFYRRGLQLRQSGQVDEAFADVRGAAELDPGFVAPHLTLAAWLLPHDPSGALAQYATVLGLARQDFALQADLAANGMILAFEALLTGLLAAALVLLWLRRGALEHAWRERLAPLVGSTGARWWVLGTFALTFFTGLGLTLPALAFLAYLWPSLRPRERALPVALLLVVLAASFGQRAIEKLSLPLDQASAPFYDVPQVPGAPWSPGREAHFAALAAQVPGNRFVQFALGWTARRGGHLETARIAYQHAAELAPDDARALNNLGTVLAMQGRADEALAAWKRATDADPACAAAWFNAAQVHTQRLEYAAATSAMARASAADFELVRNTQAAGTADGLLPLVDQWIAPAVLWRALRDAPVPARLAGTLPVALRGHVECGGWRFAGFALLASALGLAAGALQRRRIHLRACSNCGATVCRRCARLRREEALCAACAAIEDGAKTGEFGRLLLHRRRDDVGRRRRLGEIALTALVPGYGFLAQGRVLRGAFMLACTWFVVLLGLDAAPPYALEPRLTVPGQDVPVVVLASALALIVASSLAGYFHHAARDRAREAALNAASRGRVTQATRRVLRTAA